MSARTSPFTIAFYIALALWLTAQRYSGPGFYGWLLGPTVQNTLGLITFGVASALTLIVVRRAIRSGAFPWVDVGTIVTALVVSDLFWRLYLSPHAWDALKVTSGIIDAATPIVAGLGLAAIVVEWKRAKTVAV